MKSRWLVIGLLLAVGIGVSTGWPSETSEVCSTGCPNSSIQAAIDAAEDGDTLRIGPGVYSESLTITGKSLTLQGAGQTAVFIRGLPRSTALTISRSAEVTLENLTLTAQPIVNDDRIGIRVKDSAMATIRRVTISGLPEGIRIESDQSTVIRESSIVNNVIGILANGALSLEHSVVADNDVGLEVPGPRASVSLVDNTFLRQRTCGARAHFPDTTRGSGNRFLDSVLCGQISTGIRTPQAAPSTYGHITVCADGCDYATIQAAIDAAPDGALIEIGQGTYVENVTLAKNVRLSAPEGATLTGDSRTTISVCCGASDVSLYGLTVTDGRYGVAIWAGSVELSNLVIRDHTVGLVLQGSPEATVDESQITDNHDQGVWLSDTSHILLNLASLANNGSGILLSGKATATIHHTVIGHNREDGILLADLAGLTLVNSQVWNNGGWGIAEAIPECLPGIEKTFGGTVGGRGNDIPNRGEIRENGKGAVCPTDLDL